MGYSLGGNEVSRNSHRIASQSLLARGIGQILDHPLALAVLGDRHEFHFWSDGATTCVLNLSRWHRLWRVVSTIFRTFLGGRLIGFQAAAPWRTGVNSVSIARERRLPDLVLAMCRSRAETNIKAEWLSENAPTTRVRRRIAVVGKIGTPANVGTPAPGTFLGPIPEERT